MGAIMNAFVHNKPYVSYRHKTNKNRVLSIALELLRRFDFEPNYDGNYLKDSLSFTPNIMLSKINESGSFFLFACDEYQHSRLCRLEIVYAILMKKPVVLVLFDDIMDPEHFIRGLFRSVCELVFSDPWVAENFQENPAIVETLKQFNDLSYNDFRSKFSNILVYSRDGMQRERLLYALMGKEVPQKQQVTEPTAEVLVVGDPNKLLDCVDLLVEGLRTSGVHAIAPNLQDGKWRVENLNTIKRIVYVLPYREFLREDPEMVELLKSAETLVPVLVQTEGTLEDVVSNIRLDLGSLEPELVQRLCVDSAWIQMDEMHRRTPQFSLLIQEIKQSCQLSSGDS